MGYSGVWVQHLRVKPRVKGAGPQVSDDREQGFMSVRMWVHTFRVPGSAFIGYAPEERHRVADEPPQRLDEPWNGRHREDEARLGGCGLGVQGVGGGGVGLRVVVSVLRLLGSSV